MIVMMMMMRTRMVMMMMMKFMVAVCAVTISRTISRKNGFFGFCQRIYLASIYINP